MEEMLRAVSDKISSYNIFNNLLPGVIFCYTLEITTRFTLSAPNIITQLFIWYFAGMIISRVGSIIIEYCLKNLKIRQRPYLIFADYKQYVAAAKADPEIAILSEVNNTYRTIIALVITWGIIYIYDEFFYDWVSALFPAGNKILFILSALFLMLLFIKSYKKQTNYIRQRVEKYTNDSE